MILSKSIIHKKVVRTTPDQFAFLKVLNRFRVHKVQRKEKIHIRTLVNNFVHANKPPLYFTFYSTAFSGLLIAKWLGCKKSY